VVTAAEVRNCALRLPEARELETWGHPTFRVRDKIFASLAPDGRTAGVKATLEAQQALIATDPATFSASDYTGRFGWTTIQLANVDPDELEELVVEAWRRTAPKKLVAAFDAR
jgi:hypothetical protein